MTLALWPKNTTDTSECKPQPCKDMEAKESRLRPRPNPTDSGSGSNNPTAMPSRRPPLAYPPTRPLAPCWVSDSASSSPTACAGTDRPCSEPSRPPRSPHTCNSPVAEQVCYAPACPLPLDAASSVPLHCPAVDPNMARCRAHSRPHSVPEAHHAW